MRNQIHPKHALLVTQIWLWNSIWNTVTPTYGDTRHLSDKNKKKQKKNSPGGRGAAHAHSLLFLHILGTE